MRSFGLATLKRETEKMDNEEPKELNIAKRAAQDEASRLKLLGWSDEEIDRALGAWR